MYTTQTLPQVRQVLSMSSPGSCHFGTELPPDVVEDDVPSDDAVPDSTDEEDENQLREHPQFPHMTPPK